MKFLSAVAATGAAAAAGWFQSQQVATAGIWGLVAIGVITVGTFLFKLWWAVPADMAAEAGDAVMRLKAAVASHYKPMDDVGLKEGIGYALTGRWGVDAWEEGQLTAVHRIAEAIRRLAASERLHVWGKGPGAAEIHQPIPPYFLRTTGFDFLTLTVGLDPTVRTEKDQQFTPSRWQHLRLNKAEMEREFPTPWEQAGA